MDLLKWLMNPNKKIYHDNDLKSELMEMELSPRRILWLVLAKLEKDGVDIVFNPDYLFVITAKEYAALSGVSESVAYKQLKRGIEIIRSHLMRIPERNILTEQAMEGKNKDRMVLFTAASYGVYSDGDGYVELRLDPIMAPYISRLKSNFTGQYLLSALRLPDGNANKLYLLLCEWVSSGMIQYKDVTIEELKSSLMVSDVKTYELFNDFKNLFIKRAIKKIIEVTEFTKIEMQIIQRKSRKAHMVRISYSYTNQLDHLKKAGKSASHVEHEQPSNDEENRKKFDKEWYTQEEAKELGLKWKDGLTVNQILS